MAKLVVCCVVLAMLFSISAAWGTTITKSVIKIPYVGTEADVISSLYLPLTATFKAIVEAQTNGRIIVESYPNKQFGGMSVILFLRECSASPDESSLYIGGLE